MTSEMSSPGHMKKIRITEKNSGIRIDKFLVEEVFFNELSRGEIIREIKNGKVLVNDKEVKASYILKENDNIEINISQKKNELISSKDVRFKIIYQDQNIIVIDKPSGLKVHPSGFEENDTLVNGLLAKFPEIKNVIDGSQGSELRPGIVHRLDKDTSGIMVIARNRQSFDELKKIFQERKIAKKYLTFVYGHLKNKKNTIKKPIARAENRKKQIIAHKKTRTKIREAVTEYEVIKEFNDYSLVEAMPRTGRMHQIRIHFFSLGNPVVGDQKYKSKKIRAAKEVRRQLLHAQKLEFELFDKKYSFESELPGDFRAFLDSLD